eukprot:TRINITY_DN1730_c0_g2_i4.p1 TRINITY_DN1730_c0_g2~~TRINITY_DN1730_c0_g2_i4.p1  ORF type:complete len:297 (+),score=142.11 TRINITY_DN1730_c0_g2_i4:87-977(+)
MSKKQERVIPTVNLPAPEAIKLYLDDDRTEDYMPVDLTFQLDRATGVALVTWNRPDSLNAIQPVLIQETIFVLEHAKHDANVKAVVFTGAGRAFSAGASLKPRTGAAVKFPKELQKVYRKKGMWHEKLDIALKAFTLAHWNCPKILVGAINGLAVGGAANMALASFYDFVICAEEAKFKYPFTTLGITPELGSSLMMPFLVGMVKAKELLLGGEWFGPQEALRMDLITKVVPLAQLLPESLQLAAKFSTNPKQEAIMRGKELLNRRLREQMSKVLDDENLEIRKCMATSNPFLSKM